MADYFRTRYFRLVLNNGQVLYRKKRTIKGILADEVYTNEDYQLGLMCQDLHDEYGDDCDLWEISKEEYEAHSQAYVSLRKRRKSTRQK